MIEPSKQIQEKGPQVLDVQIVYQKADGSTAKVKWTDDNSTALQIKEKAVLKDLKTPELLDIKREMGITKRLL